LNDGVADQILQALRQAPSGMTRTQIRDLFRRHKSSSELDQALRTLEKTGRARSESRVTGGAPKTVWFAT
jgi:hypothetical protein